MCMSLCSAFKILDKNVTSEVKNIVKIFNGRKNNKDADIKLKFFDQLILQSQSEITDSLKGKSAIYIFCLTKDFTPSVYFDNDYYSSKRRDKNIAQFNKWDHPLYLGKTYTAQSRLTEHYSDQDKSPYSLKLNLPNRCDNTGAKLSQLCNVMVFLLKEKYEIRKNILLPVVEDKLHEELKPYVGSPRV